jgi:hypothetical protein
MDNATLAAQDDVQGRSRKARAGYAFAALAIAFAVVILLQNQAAHAQINFNQIFCQVILSVYNGFANSPFFGFIQGILEGLLNLFGCVISPGA